MNEGEEDLDHDQQNDDPFEPMARSILEQGQDHHIQIRQERHLLLKPQEPLLDVEVVVHALDCLARGEDAPLRTDSGGMDSPFFSATYDLRRR